MGDLPVLFWLIAQVAMTQNLRRQAIAWYQQSSRLRLSSLIVGDAVSTRQTESVVVRVRYFGFHLSIALPTLSTGLLVVQCPDCAFPHRRRVTSSSRSNCFVSAISRLFSFVSFLICTAGGGVFSLFPRCASSSGHVLPRVPEA
jgi:hypothetical protein